MLILSNSLSQTADEGSLKLATNIVKRLKKENPDTYIVSYERSFDESDLHLQLNKFHISTRLISLLKKRKQPVLYIPFPAPTLSMAIRIWILSFFARYGLNVMMVRQYPMNRIAKILLKLSKAELIVFSKKAYGFYHDIVGDRVVYLKTGIDTNKFVPVSFDRVRDLKIKYGFDPDRPIILHVGHMKEGRNIAELMKIDEKYQVLLVVSTFSKERQSDTLKNQLLKCSNIRIIDEYIPNIEEIYQMSDVYFFPVKQIGHCIDVPLSCLEAAACNKPVITTDYGEMCEFSEKDGFFLIDDVSTCNINRLFDQALSSTFNSRLAILEYDWKESLHHLI